VPLIEIQEELLFHVCDQNHVICLDQFPW